MSSASPAKLHPVFKVAITAGVETAVKLHIQRGDDLNARDERGQTALMLAASKNKPGICSLLISAGADVTLRDSNDMDALSIAVAAHSLAAAQVIQAELTRRKPLFEPMNASEHVIAPSQEPLAVELEGERVEHDLEGAAQFNDMGDEFDVSGWVAEETLPAPAHDVSMVEAAIEVHNAISRHDPVDSSEGWANFEIFLPDQAAQILRDEDVEAAADVRRLLLRAIREGSVPTMLVEDVANGAEEVRDGAQESRLTLVISDLGSETDDRFEYSTPYESFVVFVDPEETIDEERALDEAMAFLDLHASIRQDPSYLYLREAGREKLLSADEEIALAKAMDAGIERSLDALANWRGGIVLLGVAGAQVRNHQRSLSWLFDDPSDAETESLLEAVNTVPRSLEGLIEGAEEEEQFSTGTEADFDKLAALEILTECNIRMSSGRRAAREIVDSLAIKRSFLLSIASQAVVEGSTAALLYAEAIGEYRRARDRMVVSNLKLVYSIAKRYVSSGIPLSDLMQEGNIGLLKAVDKFDWRRGFKFSTMATWWIRQQITRSIADTSFAIRLPVHVYEHSNQLRHDIDEAERLIGRTPSFRALGEKLSISPAMVEAIVRSKSVPHSLDVWESERIDQGCEQDVLFNDLAAKRLSENVSEILQGLPPKLAEIIRLRFGIGLSEPLTLEKVGKRINVTRERIRQIESKALQQLSHPARKAQVSSWMSEATSIRYPSKTRSVVSKTVERRDPPAPKINPEISAKKAVVPLGARTKLDIKLDQLVAIAVGIGKSVDDRTHNGARSICIEMAANPQTSKERWLIRSLLAADFAYLPGKGYSR